MYLFMISVLFFNTLQGISVSLFHIHWFCSSRFWFCFHAYRVHYVCMCVCMYAFLSVFVCLSVCLLPACMYVCMTGHHCQVQWCQYFNFYFNLNYLIACSYFLAQYVGEVAKICQIQSMYQ